MGLTHQATLNLDQDRLVAASTRLIEAAAARKWRGSDPYDGLWWAWPHMLVGGPRRRQAIMQLHARSPFDLRRWYRGPRPLIPKALGIFGQTAVKLHGLTAAPRAAELAREALEALSADHSAGKRAWDYHWDMQTRWSFYPAGSPNVVVTAFAVDGLALAAPALPEPRFAARARAAGEWVIEALWRDDLGGFVYHPGSDALIHNANLLGALTAWRVLPHDPRLTERVGRALERTLAGQAADGSWPYGAAANLRFVDSFHTGYVLRCLCELSGAHPDLAPAIANGAEFYARRFFEPSGAARLWPNRRFPEDGHSTGTALTALATLYRYGFIDDALPRRVAAWALENMLAGDHAVHRRYRWGTTRVSFVRWCDAHMALGLADIASLAEPAPSPDRTSPAGDRPRRGRYADPR